MSSAPFSPPRRPVGLPAEAAKQYSLHPLERTLAALAMALLVFLPWAMGGMRLWPQFIAGTLALLAFIVALIPRTLTDQHHAGGTLHLSMRRKLVHFPLFWLGLLWGALIVTQNLNPAWAFRSSEAGWWMVQLPFVAWLPRGVEGTPFGMMDGWRTLMIHGTVWLTVCALWVGITRRQTARLLLYTIALNGVVVAGAILAQRLSGTKHFLWFWDAPTPYFVAGFTYKNHGGEFLCLILALCLGLMWWHTRQAERHLAKSHPGLVWLLAALLVLVGQMFTFARAATMVGAAFLVVIVLAYFLRQFFHRRGGMPPAVIALTTLLGAGFMAFALTQLNTDLVWQKFARLMKEDQFASVTLRHQSARATLDMAAESPVVGHGAGSFRFLFPRYQQHYPEIWQQLRWDPRTKSHTHSGRRMFWEYAHNDYAQLRAEFGWLGVGFAALTLGAILVAAWRVNLFAQFGQLVMLGGPALVATSAAVDFPFHNPAILVTTAAIIALSLRWAELSSRR